MADAVADRVSRPSSADGIDDDLAALWRDVAGDGPVSRAVMSNLVVFCRCPARADEGLAPAAAALGLEEVLRRHPARAIVLYYDSGAPARPDEPPLIDVTVEVLTFGPPGSRYGVEQIVIRSACAEGAIPSIVRRLMLGDVPTTVWWTEDLSITGPLAPLVGMGRQFLFDGRRWTDPRKAVLALAPLLADPFRPDLADLNWRRLAPARQAILHAIDSRDAARRGAPGPMRIRHQRGEAALAWMLAGWARAIGATVLLPQGGLDAPIEDPEVTDHVLTASLGGELRLRLDYNRVIVEDVLGPAPFSVACPRESQAEAIAAELRVLTEDTGLHDALNALVAHFRGA